MEKKKAFTSIDPFFEILLFCMPSFMCMQYLDQVMPDIIRSCFTNQGEICLCASRLYVHQGIFDTFVERLVVCVSE